MQNPRAGDLDAEFGTAGRFAMGEELANINIKRIYCDDAWRIWAVGSSEQVGADETRTTVARITQTGEMDKEFIGSGYLFSLEGQRFEGGGSLGLTRGAFFVVSVNYKKTMLLRYSESGEETGSWLLIPEPVALTSLNPIILVQKDGKLLVATDYSVSGRGNDGLLMRRLTDGQPDPDFGKNGAVTISQDNAYVQLLDMALRTEQHDVIVALAIDAGSNNEFWLHCYELETGQLKNEFGVGGKFTYTVPGQQYGPTTFKRIFQENGQLWLAGTIADQSTGEIFVFFIRLTVMGGVDISFNGGQPIIIKGLFPYLAVQSDDKIIMLASLQYPNNIVRRYLPGGALDSGYGVGGEVFVGEVDEEILTLTIQPDNKLVMTANYRTKTLAMYRLHG